MECLSSAHYCLFLQGVSQHLRCLFFLDSQPCPIWTFTWGIRSWGAFLGSMSLTSSEGVPKWSFNPQRILSSWQFKCKLMSFSFFPIFSDLSALVARFLFSSAIVWRVFSGSCLYQKVPCFIRAPEFLERLIWACERCNGKSSPWLLVLSFCKK